MNEFDLMIFLVEKILIFRSGSKVK
jgi:hypothetical protein